MDTILVFIGCYIPGRKRPNLHVFRLDLALGRLTAAFASADVHHPAWLEMHPNGSYLYTVCDARLPANARSGAIATYAVDAWTGTLRLIGRQATGGTKPCHVSMHPSGRFLLASNYHDGNVCVLPVRPDFTAGRPTLLLQYEGNGPDPRRQQSPHAHSAVFSRCSRFAYVQDLGTDRIWQYRIPRQRHTLDALTPPAVELAPGAGPRHLLFHPNHRFAYVTNELDNTVTVLRLNPVDGQLAPIQTVPTLPPGFYGASACADLRLTPDGRFLYASNRGHDSLAIFQVRPSCGLLTAVGHEPTRGASPRGFNLDPTGQWVVVANQDGNDVHVFGIEAATGMLTHSGCRIELPQPVCVVFRTL